MKKLFILIAMLSLSTFVMAQKPEENHTKPYKEAMVILEGVKDGIQNAKDCDELELAAFGMIALFGVEDIDKVTEAEDNQIKKFTEEMDKILHSKKAALNCKDDDFFEKNDDD